jgi:hypothetical protein
MLPLLGLCCNEQKPGGGRCAVSYSRDMVEFVLAVKSVVGRELGRTSLGSSIIVVLSLI